MAALTWVDAVLTEEGVSCLSKVEGTFSTPLRRKLTWVKGVSKHAHSQRL